MQLHTGLLTASATDLGRFLSCRHLTALDIEVAYGRRKKPFIPPDPFLDLLIKRGFDHERAYLKEVETKGSAVLDIGGIQNPNARQDTLAAMKAGHPAISQALLAEGPWYGFADVLRRVDTPGAPSTLGPFSYEAYDTKLARETRGSTILQLCLYSDLIESIQGVSPEKFYVVTPIATEEYRLADYAAYYRLVKRRLLEAAASDAAALMAANYPEPVDTCDVCRWWADCNKRRRADDHLSFVAGISRLQRKELAANGIATLESFGSLTLPLPFKPKKGSKESFEKAQGQARIQLEGRRADAPLHELLLPVENGRGLARLPEPSPGDVFLDLEGDHFAAEGPREYLFGMTILETSGKTRHVKKWAATEADEKRIFEEILDEIFALWQAHPGMHVYHYAPYEPSAFKRLMGRHATREREIDRMLRAELFVDLLTVVRQGLRASVEGYSIKNLERFYAFERRADLKDAGAARHVVEFALENGDLAAITPAIRALVEDYNQEDCVSALELRTWLESLRKEHETNGVDIPRPPLEDGSASDEAEKRSAEVQAAMDALLAGVPPEKNDRTPEQQARWLLAHMLEFHRREDKVGWWEFFRHCDLDEHEDDLLDERKVIAGMKFLKEVGGTKKCPIHRYVYPSQDLDARPKDTLKTNDKGTLGTIAALDREKRTVDIKKTQVKRDEHPSWAFIHSHISSKELAGSLMRLAADVAKNGFTSKSAARDLLLAGRPRLNKGTFVLQDAEAILDFAKRGVVDLDRSILPLQGPPGAGKTYTGARMIVECVNRGMKVGITAVSHKVIRKLLDDVLDAAREMHVSVSCVQKIKSGSEKTNPPIPAIEEVMDNIRVLTALADGGAQLGAGTGFLWSREEYAGAVDVLFVDEAGQASLANVLAMSQAAKNVVLLGDPQQLEQPQRGTHPEGVDASALEHLLAGHKTIPPERGIFLAETWRLPPAISSFTSELFYEGRLKSHEGMEKQRLSGAPPYEGAGLWFEPVEHDGNTNSSPEEVKAVEAIVAKLLAKGSTWANHEGKTEQVTARNILVLAPFNAQINLLQDALESKGIHVGTVDRFQGQEAAVVIYSMATSRPEDAPRGMEFLYDLHRLNVATSRARCASILVASPYLLEPVCETPRQMRLANALCRYLEVAEPSLPPGSVGRDLGARHR